MFNETVKSGIDHAISFLHKAGLDFGTMDKLLVALIKWCQLIQDKKLEDMYRFMLHQIWK